MSTQTPLPGKMMSDCGKTHKTLEVPEQEALRSSSCCETLTPNEAQQ